MNKQIAMLIVCLMVISSLVMMPVSAASDFEISSGVLVKYNGTAASVTVPDSVTAIGDSAFANNSKLSSVTLPESVLSVGEQAFSGCTALKTVSGGADVTEVGDYAFYNTPYLNNSTDKYMMLGHVLLWYNGTESSVSIPTHCTMVASCAFLRCTYLKSFNAYDGLIRIGAGAFYGCTALSSMNLPSTLSSVGAYAFDGVPYLAGLGEFAVVGDHILVKYQGTAADVTVPNTVKRIAPRAFTSSKMTGVAIPESVYSIDDYAFADCVGIESVEFSEGLINIGNYAFSGCKSLKEILTPPTLSYIGQYAFNGDVALKGAGLCGDSLTISYNAFKGCTALAYVLLSDGVEKVYDNAFPGCTALSGVSVPPDLKDITAASLNGCTKAVVCSDSDYQASSALSALSFRTPMGDTDGDKELSILDATAIQRYLAYLVTFSGTTVALSDVNFDGEVNILDPLYIQMKIAHVV